ncbi:SET domain-containing protein-lysine N-methyltransferase [Ectothiorhodospiraceae bacterium BW-2]|nr:SET domain-containing protein-lysine N-methyltransferase [Ectothiorhodospiraceae bacterium BW-2]
MHIYRDVELEQGYHFPLEGNFVVAEREEGKGNAIYAANSYRRGEMIARFTGIILPYRTQHTLQLNTNIHLLDLSFVGYLAHSCSPNVFIDMQSFEVWALGDIDAQSALTMDYAATEDVLYRQFRCLCGSPNCRHWVTGRKEQINEQGLTYLQQRGYHG